MKTTFNILGFAGSLRKNSYNKALLRAALELVPKGAKLGSFNLEGVPPFNQDLENQPPQKVKEFKAKIRSADAILIATPEANYTLPGVLTNAMNWASRPYGDNAFDGKPVAVMGATIGTIGTARAQYHLRQSFVFLNMIPINQPEVMVPVAQEKIGEDGKVTDQKAREKIRELLESLVAWTIKLKGCY